MAPLLIVLAGTLAREDTLVREDILAMDDVLVMQVTLAEEDTLASSTTLARGFSQPCGLIGLCQSLTQSAILKYHHSSFTVTRGSNMQGLITGCLFVHG